MDKAYLSTYLNDHLSGAVTALELLKQLRKVDAGTETDFVVASLQSNITEDRRQLEALMDRLNITRSTPRQAAGWLAEKAAELKMRLDDSASGPLHLLESLDIVSSGIHGKRMLWRSLAAIAEDYPELQSTDYAQLEQRAEDQLSRIEIPRLEAARAALAAK